MPGGRAYLWSLQDRKDHDRKQRTGAFSWPPVTVPEAHMLSAHQELFEIQAMDGQRKASHILIDFLFFHHGWKERKSPHYPINTDCEYLLQLYCILLVRGALPAGRVQYLLLAATGSNHMLKNPTTGCAHVDPIDGTWVHPMD